VRAVVSSIRGVLDNITLGITIVGAITLVSGVLILVGAVAMTKFQRVYETAIYRTLGASARLVAATVAVEYGVLGLLAGCIAAIGALGLSWAIARYLLEITVAPGSWPAGVGRASDGRTRVRRRSGLESGCAREKAARGVERNELGARLAHHSPQGGAGLL
jgi:putative ABC transport system permease protein